MSFVTFNFGNLPIAKQKILFNFFQLGITESYDKLFVVPTKRMFQICVIPEMTSFPKYLILIRLPDVNAYFNSEITVIALALRALENNKQLSMTLSNDFKYLLL